MSRLAGKRLLIVGVRDESNKKFQDDMIGFGIKLYGVGTYTGPTPTFDHFFLYKYSDHHQDDKHCDVISRHLTSAVTGVDGCLTMLDENVPLAAMLGQSLGTATISPLSARVIKTKSWTLERLKEAEQRGETSRQYSSRCCKLSVLADVEEACKAVGFPAIMKTEYGCGAVATRHLSNVQETLEHFQLVQSLHDSAMGYLGSGFGTGCVLMEYLQGTEHCVDIALYHGRLVCAFVTDKGPHDLPFNFHTLTVLPSLLDDDQVEVVGRAALECCLALGADHGLFNVEFILTPAGPRLLEINARISGFCQRDFVSKCYGVDLLQLACELALDILPELPPHLFPDVSDSTTAPAPAAQNGQRENGVTASLTTQSQEEQEATEAAGRTSPDPTRALFLPRARRAMVGMALYPRHHRAALATTATPATLQRLHDAGEVSFLKHEDEVLDGDHGIQFCTLAVNDESFSAAYTRLHTICKDLGVDIPRMP